MERPAPFVHHVARRARRAIRLFALTEREGPLQWERVANVAQTPGDRALRKGSAIYEPPKAVGGRGGDLVVVPVRFVLASRYSIGGSAHRSPSPTRIHAKARMGVAVNGGWTFGCTIA